MLWGRIRIKNVGYFHMIFYSVVQTNMKWFVHTTIKAIHPLVVFSWGKCHLATKQTQKGALLGGIVCVPYDMTIFFKIYSTKKDKIIPAEYCIILHSHSTYIALPQNITSCFCMDWDMLQNCVCQTGHSLTESPVITFVVLS